MRQGCREGGRDKSTYLCRPQDTGFPAVVFPKSALLKQSEAMHVRRPMETLVWGLCIAQYVWSLPSPKVALRSQPSMAMQWLCLISRSPGNLCDLQCSVVESLCWPNAAIRVHALHLYLVYSVLSVSFLACILEDEAHALQ